ncbi:hypothetical protein FRB99_001238 [Tulasnella sp. 403]|nr:hypothetical protein FRB99_001238 [Tulasnella sp. 403]
MASVTPKQKLVVIVGGSSGLGFAALQSLLASDHSYHIVLGSRSELEPWRYGQLQPSLKTTGSTLDRLECDMSRYESVKIFASQVISKYKEPIDALVLCAGMIAATHRLTADGEDETVQVNVLSQALLIDLLEPKLGVNSQTSRVLLVTSSLHKKVPEGTVYPSTINEILTRGYEPMEVYHITKLLQVYLLYAAQEKFETYKPGVTVVAVSPGFVPDTGLNRELGFVKSGVMHYLLPHAPFSTTVPDGGRNIARGIVQNFPSGTYFSQRKVEETSEETYNLELRRQWAEWFVAKKVWRLQAQPADVSQPASRAPVSPDTVLAGASSAIPVTATAAAAAAPAPAPASVPTAVTDPAPVPAPAPAQESAPAPVPPVGVKPVDKPAA